MKFLNLFSLIVVSTMLMFSCKSDGETKATTADATPAATVPAAATTADKAPAAEPAVPAGPLTTLEFAESTFDYGEIMEGAKVDHQYKFTNTGTEPLIISNAKGSCGCTVPNWPREPIPPGGTGVIDVTFDSKGKGKVGGSPQSKRVTITANTDPANTYLTIKGTVNKEEGAEDAKNAQ